MLKDTKADVQLICSKAKEASKQLALTNLDHRNSILKKIQSNLVLHKQQILNANNIDCDRAVNESDALIDRLRINEKVFAQMLEGIESLLKLPDPLGNELASWQLRPGLIGKKISVPIGVMGIIYESRPNVTVEAATLAIKSGNSVVLRGSSAAIESNKALVASIREAIISENLPADTILLIEDTDRSSVEHLLKMRNYIDVLVPRGSASLIKYVVDNSSVPVIETGAGVCHLYIAPDSSIDMAINILLNGKVQRPSVCNSLETLLIDSSISNENIQIIVSSLLDNNVECKGCEKICLIDNRVNLVDEFDWSTEYQSLTISIRIVDDIEQAISHIEQYGTKHSEAIVTDNKDIANKFCQSIDAAVVYHNASTRFSDGFEFGFGAELGISTQKLHARGPMGLSELTSYKYIVVGSGHCR